MLKGKLQARPQKSPAIRFRIPTFLVPETFGDVSFRAWKMSFPGGHPITFKKKYAPILGFSYQVSCK